jgi:hypothetical protein
VQLRARDQHHRRCPAQLPERVSPDPQCGHDLPCASAGSGPPAKGSLGRDGWDAGRRSGQPRWPPGTPRAKARALCLCGSRRRENTTTAAEQARRSRSTGADTTRPTGAMKYRRGHYVPRGGSPAPGRTCIRQDERHTLLASGAEPRVAFCAAQRSSSRPANSIGAASRARWQDSPGGRLLALAAMRTCDWRLEMFYRSGRHCTCQHEGGESTLERCLLSVAVNGICMGYSGRPEPHISTPG